MPLKTKEDGFADILFLRETSPQYSHLEWDLNSAHDKVFCPFWNFFLHIKYFENVRRHLISIG